MLRLADPEDAPAIRAIYEPYVRETSITFEESVPSVAEVRERIEAKQPAYPWLVCELDGEVVGYAYAGPLRERAAYRWVVETSVYVDRAAEGQGVGRAVYSALLDALELQRYLDAYAVITVPNPRSTDFHERMGFERVVGFPAMGYKHDAWADVEWWRYPLAEKPDAPAQPRPVDAIAGSDAWREAIERAESHLQA